LDFFSFLKRKNQKRVRITVKKDSSPGGLSRPPEPVKKGKIEGEILAR
jgi:hypothetical protein